MVKNNYVKPSLEFYRSLWVDVLSSITHTHTHFDGLKYSLGTTVNNCFLTFLEPKINN